ncbi:MAG: hypothetical protein AUK47_21495 [Deltaproteobacteria bacterium CG2_30_63_29]|nr:MAG: hypothetical protein AUK47_21495 [Deltaproteobacteria bacterium CG2_30_63_29]
MKDRMILMLKGACMGFADVVPGVSGGTMALILGIYTRLIDAIKSIDFRLLKPLLKATKGSFRAEARKDLFGVMKEMDIPWLLTLVSGIAIAFAIGSKIIPSLMESHPELMNAFFFGLVLASVSAPYKLIERFGFKEAGIALLLAVGTYLMVGASVTPPIDYREVTVTDTKDGGQTLKELAQLGPSALPPEGIYWDSENEALRTLLPMSLERGLDPKATDNPYNELVVPAGTKLSLPAPTPWFIFIAGFVAICAMVLPGISGSFILLVLGSYYFMLNALKGFVKAATHLHFPGTQFVYVLLFCLGAGLGLVVFSRVLSYLLRKYPTTTMSALIGIMLGCLRVIWPFKERSGEVLVNSVPSLEVYGSTVYLAVFAFVAGLVVVLGLTFVANKRAES